MYHLRYECGFSFVCLCGKRRTQLGNLMQHIKLKHPNEIEWYKSKYVKLPINPSTSQKSKQWTQFESKSNESILK